MKMVVNLRMPVEMHEAVAAFAKAMGLTKTKAIRLAIAQMLWKEGTPVYDAEFRRSRRDRAKAAKARKRSGAFTGVARPGRIFPKKPLTS